EIRVRFPEDARTLDTLQQLKLRTNVGLVPLTNFITITPARRLGEISRFETVRFIDIRSDHEPGVNANEKIAEITAWIEENPLPEGMEWSFSGDQEEQAESMDFLSKAFMGALGLMFAILLAQFNSLYNSILVLSAVVMSATGVLLGMLVMQQPFSIIMTGTGVVALAGIVVNNNIVLIDTYREYSEQLPRIEAIIRTAEQRIRPVLLTTITTIAGLTPMMFATSIEFSAVPGAVGGLLAGGFVSGAGWDAFFGAVFSVGAPTALWWVQLATAVVFGLGVSTFLTLLVTPAALAIRVWVMEGAFSRFGLLNRALVWCFSRRAGRKLNEEARLRKGLKREKAPEINWEEELLIANQKPTIALTPPKAFPDPAE
ncbi:MAG: efflux RND transporter permease subunit, partial [Pseudomonadota bacterium]